MLEKSKKVELICKDKIGCVCVCVWERERERDQVEKIAIWLKIEKVKTRKTHEWIIKIDSKNKMTKTRELKNIVVAFELEIWLK